MKNKTNSRPRRAGSLSNYLKSGKRCPGVDSLKLVALVCFFVLAAPSFGQAPAEAPVSATITFANGETINIGSNSDQTFAPIETLPGETLGIQLQLPLTFVNSPVGLGALDGGFVPEEIQVATDGSTTFAFRAGAQPGLYRIILNTANTSTMLQFLVRNVGNP